MRADKEVKIIARLLEEKTQLLEKALAPTTTARTKMFIKAEINGIDIALKIIREEFGEDV